AESLRRRGHGLERPLHVQSGRVALQGAACGRAHLRPCRGEAGAARHTEPAHGPAVAVSLTRRHVLLAGALPLLRAAPARKIVVAGGHPGDPECGCAGTIARLTALGHEVVLLYLNRGEGFCGDAPLDRCAAIRTAEARSAAKILNARAAFADQVD